MFEGPVQRMQYFMPMPTRKYEARDRNDDNPISIGAALSEAFSIVTACDADPGQDLWQLGEVLRRLYGLREFAIQQRRQSGNY
jgi:hypothetical protein